MTVIINGEEKELPDGATLSECILHLNWNPDVVVAELNGQVVEKCEYEKIHLNPADSLELLHFVGGG